MTTKEGGDTVSSSLRLLLFIIDGTTVLLIMIDVPFFFSWTKSLPRVRMRGRFSCDDSDSDLNSILFEITSIYRPILYNPLDKNEIDLWTMISCCFTPYTSLCCVLHIICVFVLAIQYVRYKERSRVNLKLKLTLYLYTLLRDHFNPSTAFQISANK